MYRLPSPTQPRRELARVTWDRLSAVYVVGADGEVTLDKSAALDFSLGLDAIMSRAIRRFPELCSDVDGAVSDIRHHLVEGCPWSKKEPHPALLRRSLVGAALHDQRAPTPVPLLKMLIGGLALAHYTHWANGDRGPSSAPLRLQPADVYVAVTGCDDDPSSCGADDIVDHRSDPERELLDREAELRIVSHLRDPAFGVTHRVVVLALAHGTFAGAGARLTHDDVRAAATAPRQHGQGLVRSANETGRLLGTCDAGGAQVDVPSAESWLGRWGRSGLAFREVGEAMHELAWILRSGDETGAATWRACEPNRAAQAVNTIQHWRGQWLARRKAVGA